MTTVAYRDGWMVADSQLTSGNTMKHRVAKIERLPDGRLVGLAGDWPSALRALAWIRAGGDPESTPDDLDDATCLMVASESGVALYDSDLTAMPLLDAFAAIGSGAEYAVGAMEAGATAEEAVLIACRRDPSSSFPIHKLQYVGQPAPAKSKTKRRKA
jgi:ATP-dependent HslUV protease subunit HslV